MNKTLKEKSLRVFFFNKNVYILYKQWSLINLKMILNTTYLVDCSYLCYLTRFFYF